jgi:hypothetical protein
MDIFNDDPPRKPGGCHIPHPYVAGLVDAVGLMAALGPRLRTPRLVRPAGPDARGIRCSAPC